MIVQKNRNMLTSCRLSVEGSNLLLIMGIFVGKMNRPENRVINQIDTFINRNPRNQPNRINGKKLFLAQTRAEQAFIRFRSYRLLE